MVWRQLGTSWRPCMCRACRSRSSSLGRIVGWEAGAERSRSQGCTVCASPADHIVVLCPGRQSTVLFYSPGSINHLFTQLEDYSCSVATSSPSCHGASQGRHRHSCVKVSRFLSPFSMATNGVDESPAASLPPAPTSSPPRSDGLGFPHQFPSCLPAKTGSHG